MKSYIRSQSSIGSFLSEYLLLYRSLKQRSAEAEQDARRIIADYENIARLVGRDLSSCDLLEVGVGQMPLRLAFFTSKAKTAVGVDLDVIAVRYGLDELVRMARCNGWTRTVRTFGRQWMGLNRNLIQQFCRQMGLQRFPALRIVQGDICAGTQFNDASYDVIVSTNVFEHLANPEAAVKEIARLLRPGGVVLTLTCHWGQANAIHDLEAMYGIKPARWAHLRPSLAEEVKQHAYVNDLRMADWQELFSRYFDSTTALPPGFVAFGSRALGFAS